MKEEIDIRKMDGSKPPPKNLARAVLNPVNIKWKDRPS